MRRLALIVALCVCAGGALVYPYDAQDGSRLGLTDAVVSYGTLRIDRWAGQTGDKARFDGHWYSDKAPAMSTLAVPGYAVLAAAGAVRPADGPWRKLWTLWLLRLLTGGVAYAALLVLVGVAADRLVPGTGAAVAVAVGVGTFSLGLAATSFSHLGAAALALSSFLLLMDARERPERDAMVRTMAAGLAIGCAVLFDYLAAIALVVFVAYLAAVTRSPKRVALYLAGGLPCIAALGLYDTLAFGSPFHLSYRYITGFNGREQKLGFFGARLPRLGYLRVILFSRRGLLLTSPVIVLAAFGLLRLRRQRQAEAIACIAIVITFFLYSAGYFDPLGGRSPGPRFLGAAIPFAALGLAPLLRHHPRAVGVVLAASVVGAIADAVRWAWITDTSTWMLLDMRPVFAALLVGLPAAAAFAIAMRPLLTQASTDREAATGS